MTYLSEQELEEGIEYYNLIYHWKIFKEPKIVLGHKCSFLSGEIINRNTFFSVVFKDNSWQCSYCGEKAPKNIALFADLCYCDKNCNYDYPHYVR